MDHRFACCISWGPEWDYHTKWQQRLARIERGEDLSLSVPWQHLLWVFGVKTKEEAFRKLEGFKLDGVIQKMRCPYLLVHGEGDQQAPFEHAQKMIAACGSPTEAHEGLHARRRRLPPLPGRQRQHRHGLYVGLGVESAESRDVNRCREMEPESLFQLPLSKIVPTLFLNFGVCTCVYDSPG